MLQQSPSSVPPQPSLGAAGRIARVFQSSALTPLLAIAALLLGLFAVLVTPREEEPQIDVTMANVMIAFPGASSADVQALVALPAEQVLSQIAGVDHTYSVARPGIAVLTVQFEVGVARTEALVRLYDALEANSDWLPRDLGVLEPIVKPKGIDDVPVLAITLWGRDARPAADLERVAHSLEVEFARIGGVREVRTIGGPGRVVSVALDPARMRERAVDVMGLRRALAAANLGMPSGSVPDVERGSGMLSVQTGEFLRSAEDVASLVVGVHRGRPVYLNEVAQVSAGAAQPGQYVWFTPGSAAQEVRAGAERTDPVSPGQVFPTVTVTVTKKPGSNAVDVARDVRARLDSLHNRVVPENVEWTVTRDYGQTASDKANQLILKLAFATASVIVLVGLALGRREAVVVGAAVLLTLVATLFASWAWGFTLNRVSLFALIFSIGILVDDAIVVVENIHRHQAMNPSATLKSIIPGAVDEVGGPTILATLTVIAALLPMAFVSGLMGPYMSPIPINASMGMAISLAIAFTFTPWLAARLMKPHKAHDAAAAGPSRTERFFTRVLGPFLRTARARRLLAIAVLLLMAASVALVPLQAVVMKMLPFDNKSEFQLVVDLPAGTALEDTAAALHDLGAFLAQQPEVRNLQGYAGTAAPITFNGLVRQYYLRADAELGELQVNLVDKAHRREKSHAIATRLRPQLVEIAQRHGARVQVVEVPPGPPVRAPIVAEVYGPDEEGRVALARRVADAFAQTRDIVGIDTTTREDAPRAFLRIDRARADSLGIPAAGIAQTVHGALSGVDAAWLHQGFGKYPVAVRLQLPREAQGGLDALLALPMRAADGSMIALSELVRVERGVIDKPRYTKDLLGVQYVLGDMGGVLDSPLYGLAAIRASLPRAALPGTGPLGEYWIHQPADAWSQYAIKWDGESQITYETFRDMGAAYAVGLVLIYLLVVAEFRSYLAPLVIMAPIPLTLIGVMPGHALLGAQFTATSMIGMIALAGIIVRNSILLVDFIELQVAEGVAYRDALIRAAAVRAQPIALTALAAMTGAFFILDDPIFSGLAVSLIFGILVSTALTLIVIPVLHYAVFRRRHEAPAGAGPSSPSSEGVHP
ncbi:MAG: efflux RND transporter permease subunit [Burkholderiaceae bacterium]|nr:efflux RND transporter permease subunit [Burkholderiaceae bacterium]